MSNSTTVLHVHEMASPIGPLVLVASSEGLCSIEFGTMESNRGRLVAWANRWFGAHELVPSPEALRPVHEQLEQYFRKERKNFDYKLDLHGTEFQKRVWTGLCSVAYGETASYKQIAESIGSPKAVRAVGGANNRNPIPIIIPCHRIIGAGGALVGYGGGLDIKIHLLRLEGSAAGNERTI
ncbi:methylated-DNA--[protein]-cysteine S-methyltransferase [Paenibacillus hexagrammi]|uniref:Methylated-DNA--protein-cysteine methyltransferase n=1 Tax=Paenibacillus hexagrammi TaxID=2908839 RepID=A0ABY3SH44_9BACL|nr:methylated-DNA--[protein]-cysteine S-methyltransferase [Paenibacillus sp. YPD9-1]UJF32810.1 methylated-DNA--[protein]-cysteine S-methyltransferase [Paenibacillus sp. YPD9-1]